VPTVLRIDGLLVVIYPNDHLPAHVHVVGAGKEALFHLNCPVGPPALRRNFRFSRRELSGIQEKLTPHVAAVGGPYIKPPTHRVPHSCGLIA
jgi:hypothetical protein